MLGAIDNVFLRPRIQFGEVSAVTGNPGRDRLIEPGHGKFHLGFVGVKKPIVTFK
jgi:hypothetical protein